MPVTFSNTERTKETGTAQISKQIYENATYTTPFPLVSAFAVLQQGSL